MKIHFNNILSSTPRPSKWYLSLKFPHKNPLCTSLIHCTCNMTRPSLSSWLSHPSNIRWEQIIKLLTTPSPPLPCYLVPPRPLYSPQHPILKHPQPMFLPQCERPSFTPTQTTDCKFNIFGQQTGRQNILYWMAAGIPWFQTAHNFLTNEISICLCHSQILCYLHVSPHAPL